MDFWRNVSLLAATSMGDEVSALGFEYLATTTVYANTCCASCGGVDTAALVAGTDYYAVASAQAMQSVFPGGECCWCGQAGGGSGAAPMGCKSCATGRFLRKRPYGAHVMQANDALFEREIKLVVADICPHQGNEAWCPGSPGSVNTFGSKNHFDFADPPAGFDNYYLAFSPAACSAEIQQRLGQMSQCGR